MISVWISIKISFEFMFTKDRLEVSRQCPKCGSSQVVRAARAGGLDQILSLFNRYPYQCFQCPSISIFHLIGRK
jgi:predicted RNA-binding Zn-ribbon protein involved in translation (DUF1610 family)